jgi:hypothetical protein
MPAIRDLRIGALAPMRTIGKPAASLVLLLQG